MNDKIPKAFEGLFAFSVSTVFSLSHPLSLSLALFGRVALARNSFMRQTVSWSVFSRYRRFCRYPTCPDLAKQRRRLRSAINKNQSFYLSSCSTANKIYQSLSSRWTDQRVSDETIFCCSCDYFILFFVTRNEIFQLFQSTESLLDFESTSTLATKANRSKPKLFFTRCRESGSLSLVGNVVRTKSTKPGTFVID